MKAFNVYLNGKKIDKIFYSDISRDNTDDVRRSLVEHDGYDPRIVVRREIGKKKCVQCGQPSIKGLKPGQGLCQKHFDEIMYGKTAVQTAARHKIHRLVSPHGMCDDYCIEHERDPSIERCK